MTTLMVAGAPAQPAVEGDPRVPLHVAVWVSGQAAVKRSGWSSYASLKFGTLLRRGDLLRFDGEARAKVVCSDLSVHELSAGIHGVPCVDPGVLLDRRGHLVNLTRDRISGVSPFIISPRRTALRNPRPTLRWSAVEGATEYVVEVRADPDFQWRARVGAVTELKYPEWAPPLKPGLSYKLLVATADRPSNGEQTPDLGFRMLEARHAKAVRNEERRIAALDLPDGATRFLLAKMFAGYQMNSEAIQMLEELLKSTPEPACARLLGDLYVTVALTRHAESQYLTALRLSRQGGDEEGSAIAHYSLGRIYRALGNTAAARQHLISAGNLYQELGDRHMVSEVERYLPVSR